MNWVADWWWRRKAQWCELRGHRWEHCTQLDGSECRRCHEYRPRPLTGGMHART